MTYMKNDCLPISPNQFRAHAEKAVQCYLHEQFPKYFSAEEKEDLVSEVVLRMWRSMGSFDPARGALSTWVGTIARNVVRSAALAKWNRTDISHRLEEQELSVDESCLGLYRSGEFSADGELLAEELLDGFYSALDSERDTRLLGWQLEGLSAAEMAKREGITTESVHTALCRMRRRLREAA